MLSNQITLQHFAGPPQRLTMWLLLAFAGLAALLAAVGIYGVMAYSVLASDLLNAAGKLGVSQTQIEQLFESFRVFTDGDITSEDSDTPLPARPKVIVESSPLV